MKKLYFNGEILTMAPDKATGYKWPEAVLVDNGVISQVGKLSDVEKYADDKTEMVDLKGTCLMPSFIDAHSHVVTEGRFSLFVNLSEAGSFKDIADMLRNHMTENKMGSQDVLMGFGYDENFLAEGRHPDKELLDSVSTEIPIVIVHVSVHLVCVNSKALEIAGITRETPDPEGGLIGRVKGTMEPSGYLEESGMMLIKERVMSKVKSDDEDIKRNITRNYIKYGITTVQDGATTKEDFELLKQMAMDDKLKIDVVSYPAMIAGGVELLHGNREFCNIYVNRLKIGGYKLVLDGSPQGKTAWLTEPYLTGRPDYYGYPWMKDDDVEDYLRIAIKEKQQVLTHCNGDASSEQLLNAYEKVLKETGSHDDLRPVMIHCQTVRNDQLDRMAKINMIASIFAGHVYYWGDVHLINLGKERGNHISPVKDAMDRGVKINLHQDTPVTVPDMLHTVWCAVNRLSRKGVRIGEDQCIDVYEALKAVTIYAAYEYFEEDSKGTIEKGKRADLVILSESPLKADKMKIKDIKVLETIKDGETIYKV